MVVPGGVAPPTPGFSDQCSYQTELQDHYLEVGMRFELMITEVAAPLLNRLDTQPDNEKDTYRLLLRVSL